MPKKKESAKININVRDILLVLLLVVTIGSNWLWYQAHVSQQESINSESSAMQQQQSDVNKLTACVNEGIKPCDLTQDAPY